MSTRQPMDEIDQLRQRLMELESKEKDYQRAINVIEEGKCLATLNHDINLALIRNSYVKKSLQQCTQTLVDHLDAAFARIWTFNEKEQMLELQASSGIYTHIDGGHSRIPLGKFKIGQIAEMREPHLTNSVIGDPRVNDQEWARRENMVAFAGYPLLVEDRLIGVMALFARHPLAETILDALSTVSSNIAVGIERLYMQEERISLLARERAARTLAENAQRRLYDLLQQAPAIICVLRGPQHVYELANPLYLQIIGNRDIVGKPIREALPELEDQGFFELLDHVYTTGEPFIGDETEVKLDRHHSGELESIYLNFVYQPSRISDGTIDGILVHAVDVTELVQVRDAIKRSEERLKLAQRVGHIGSFEWNIRNNRIFWTPELEILYGLPAGGFEGLYENWAQRVHPDDLQQAQENLLVSARGESTFNVEFRIIWPDGTIRWMLAKGDIIPDDKDQPFRMVGVNIDITERKEAEQQLKELYQSVQDLNENLEMTVARRTEDLRRTNAELQRSNQELQDFAYVASHDLQEPLRKIQAFGNLLEEEYGDTLSDGNIYLDRMRSAAKRMSVLIDDLLTFSRVTTKAQPLVTVDLNGIVQQIVEDLETRLQGSHGVIEVQPLPTIEADPRQMYQMLQNLIANALKFHRPDTPPIVKVSAEIQAEESQEARCVLYVEDNGIGFDEKYLDRIFTVFQRLHGKNEYEGTGIGLAVVRKIVERHQGVVTARSTPGQGTTFIVTLPINHQNKGGK